MKHQSSFFITSSITYRIRQHKITLLIYPNISFGGTEMEASLHYMVINLILTPDWQKAKRAGSD